MQRSTFTLSAKKNKTGNGWKWEKKPNKVTADTGVVVGPAAELGQCATSVCAGWSGGGKRLSSGQEMQNDSPAEPTGSRKKAV